MLTVENLEERQRIGDTIRKARKANKITQKNLSDALNIRQDVVSDYENGKIKVIPFEKRVKLASILEIPLVSLLYSDEKSSDKLCIDTLKRYFKSTVNVKDNNHKGVTNCDTPNGNHTSIILDEKGVDDVCAILSEMPSAKFIRQLLEISAPYPLAQSVQLVIAGIGSNEKYSDAVDLLQSALTQLFISRGLAVDDAASLASFFGDAYIRGLSQ